MKHWVMMGLLIAGGAGFARADEMPAAAPGAGSVTPSPVERGKYVATICGCAGCHTPFGPSGRDAAKLYAGSAPRRKGGRGTPNITPDPETGIGKWTDEQIIAAVREGKTPDGSRLSPGMPSAAYHGMTDADAAALVAYLRSVPPVVNRIPAGEPEKAGRRPAALPPATGNVDDAADPVKHGGYLAGLLRCAGCHTPEKGKLKGRMWAGGKEFKMPMGKGEVFWSANLTSDDDTGLGKWTADQIVTAVRDLKRPDGSKIGGPMNWLADGYAALTDADASAIAAFIKAIPPVKNKVRTAAGKAGARG